MQAQVAQTIWASSSCISRCSSRHSLVSTLAQLRHTDSLSFSSSSRRRRDLLRNHRGLLHIVMAQDEQKAAQEAAALADKDEETIFDKVTEESVSMVGVYMYM